MDAGIRFNIVSGVHTASAGAPPEDPRLRQVLTQYVGVMQRLVQALQAQQQSGVPSGTRVDQEELRVIELVNGVRQALGIPPVQWHAGLAQAALGHATHMASVGRMAHDGLGNGTAESRVRAVGFRGAWGENVAAGQRDAFTVVRDWMRSPGHLRNILDPRWNLIAVERVRGVDGRIYWAQNFGRS